MDDFNALNLVGRSPAFVDALNLIRKFADCEATVLIEGETGTGKELAARAIHYLGSRREGPFVPVNCGGIPESLVESEFFGHTRGAFTDAKEARRGVIAQSQGGTLFLDEVDALSARSQVALLRFLQDREYRPVGGATLFNADVRVVAASNADLAQMSQFGRYRQDLLYRLNVLSVQLPPLRERRMDVQLLAEMFLRRLSHQYGTANKHLHPETVEFLNQYAWPGNVRELENFIHRAFLLSERDHPMVRGVGGYKTGSTGSGDTQTQDWPSFAKAKARAIVLFEREYLEKALNAAEGNVTLAARRAGKERRSFGRLLKKHGIQKNQYAAD